MKDTILSPDQDAFPNRYRWSVDACRRLSELGFLEGKYEVIDGEVVVKMGQKPAHRIAVVLLVEWLIGLFGARRVQSEGPIALPVPDGIYSEPEPDVAVTREPTTAYADRHPGPADLLFVAEISDTTLRTDLMVKARLYARAAIPEFWAFDLAARRVHIHRHPTNGEYASVMVHEQGETVSLACLPDDTICVADILPPPVT
jgi:Uma2 family endonuclease